MICCFRIIIFFKDGIGSYKCECKKGFDGKYCENNIDDCFPNKCMNGGICIDRVAYYSCSCPIGYTGKNCHTNIDDCNPMPCKSGKQSVNKQCFMVQ